MMQRLNLTLVFGLLLGLVGCGSLPTECERSGSRAFMHSETTTLGQIFSENATPSPGSGFVVLEGGDESLRTRIGLSKLAERSIDAQYFIWNAGTTGKMLGGHLMLAAEHGKIYF